MVQNETETGTGKQRADRRMFARRRPRLAWRALGAACLFSALSCVDPTQPQPQATLHILRIPPSAPPLQSTSVQFWAKKGVTRTGKIFFTNGSGGQGSEYARLTIGPNSLKALPNGTPIAPGDSVLVTMTVVDPTQTLFSLAPHGLTFNNLAPAKLKLFYTEADHDFDGDGDQDLIDTLIEQRLAIWRQPSLGALFTRLLTLLQLNFDSVQSNLKKFSQYAIAF